MYTLKFTGPYKFIDGEQNLAKSDDAKNEGIYIWVIKNQETNQNFVHYIGETVSFAKRQKEHLIQILGLNYRIIDADYAKRGVEKIIWNGAWRDKSADAISNLTKNYASIAQQVPSYLDIIDIYFAPTQLETQVRRHIEGCLGWNLRNNHPECKTFYPDDNHVGTKSKKLNELLHIELPEPIMGIDPEMII